MPDPGFERIKDVEEIATIVAGSWSLSASEREEIERIREELGVRFCRRCGYCEPCPEGVRISLMMDLRSIRKRTPAEVLTSSWIAGAVDGAGQCIECGVCEEKCPYQLPIREMLVENITFYEETLQAGGTGQPGRES